MAQIELCEVYKNYGSKDSKVTALDNINLRINKGELIAIIGPSGSGKTTLLNILGLMDNKSEGKYFIDGKEVQALSKDKLAEMRNEKFGFVFQNFNLLYDYNLIDNVVLPLTYSKDKKNMKEKAIKILEELGLKDHVKKKPDELSGGQKQRVAISRALVNNPDIILADEPTGALDTKTGMEVISLLKEINKNGRTVIIITHDINIANQCDRIIKIVDGKIE